RVHSRVSLSFLLKLTQLRHQKEPAPERRRQLVGPERERPRLDLVGAEPHGIGARHERLVALAGRHVSDLGHELEDPRHLLGEDRKRRLVRSEEHTSELQSRGHLVCRLLVEKKEFESLSYEQRSVLRKSAERTLQHVVAAPAS